MTPPSATLPSRYWAKSPTQGETRGESLAVHSAYLARTLSTLAARAPHLPDVAADPRLWHRAFWSCWLHDLGKSASGFQRMLQQPGQPWRHRHEVLSLAFLPWVAPPESEDFGWIAAAVASHHKDAPDLFRQYPLAGPAADLDLEAIVGELADDAILGVAGWLAQTAPGWLDGTSLAKVGVESHVPVPSDIDVERFRREAPAAIVRALTAYQRIWQQQRQKSADGAARRQALVLRGLLLLSDHLASGHAPDPASLDIPEPSRLLERLGPAGTALRSHQEGASRHLGSLVLAAPTGSGKTEAAVLWASRQLTQANVARKLIYLLPYQASLNAMRARLQELLGTEVGLLHARAAQVLYRQLAERSYSGPAAERAARRATDLARLHHPAVWLATPYQLLRAAYRLRGYEQTWAALGQALVVVDEPHAYEPERLGLILGLLSELATRWGARVCAMTATMPRWLRELLQTSLGAAFLPVDPDLFAAFRRHRLLLLPGELTAPGSLATIAGLAREGRSVLVCANTIARAQELRELLRALLPPDQVWLLHSRFTGEDRLAKEALLQERLQAGVPTARTASGLVVVATQVVEVSLDLDFDTLFSDPAPLEALAQRFGRVNRRGTKGLAPVHVFRAPVDGQGVYDARLVERTVQILQAQEGQPLDEALLSDYLDDVYADDLAAEFARQTQDARSAFERSCLSQLYAFESDDQLGQEFDQLFDGSEVLPASLEAAFRARADRSVLEAQALLVPISDKQRLRLRSRMRWDGDFKLWIADLPYDPELGLEIPLARAAQ